jgi:hypothetical protein
VLVSFSMKIPEPVLRLLGIRALYQAVVRQIRKELSEYIRLNRQNIGLARDLKALFETAEFVECELSQVNSSPDPESLLKESLKAVTLPGLCLEFGVYRGKTINIIAGQIQGPVYGFDSFEGLPDYWRDTFDQGAFAVPDLPQVNANVKLIKGWFSETLPGFLKEHPEKFSFVHVDCDLYGSTVSVFTLGEDRFQENTVIVFDEYFNYPGWKQGEYRAFMEFLSRTDFTFEYLGYCRMSEQVAVRLKTKKSCSSPQPNVAKGEEWSANSVSMESGKCLATKPGSPSPVS